MFVFLYDALLAQFVYDANVVACFNNVVACFNNVVMYFIRSCIGVLCVCLFICLFLCVCVVEGPQENLAHGKD